MKTRQEKRYVITMDFYAWAKNDKQILKQAHKLVEKMKKKLDNQAKILRVEEVPFASPAIKEVYNVTSNIGGSPDEVIAFMKDKKIKNL